MVYVCEYLFACIYVCAQWDWKKESDSLELVLQTVLSSSAGAGYWTLDLCKRLNHLSSPKSNYLNVWSISSFLFASLRIYLELINVSFLSLKTNVIMVRFESMSNLNMWLHLFCLYRNHCRGKSGFSFERLIHSFKVRSL